jgi:hypothetical protein
MIDRPTALTLRDLFKPQRAVVPIVGVPGTGKSTLACAIARWAIASPPDEPLASHPMLPVFIVEDTLNLVASVAKNLRRMLSDEELPEDLLRWLLRKQRLLVVVDALSERGTATQRHVETLYSKDSPVNALVITSRREPDLSAVRHTSLYPERLTAERLTFFISEYLQCRHRQVDTRFTSPQQLESVKQVLRLAKIDGPSTSVTPLLVTLFVESAINRIREDLSLQDMQEQVPEVFLDYIRRSDPSGLVRHDELIGWACALATTSLGDSLRPSEFRREDGINAIRDRGAGERAEWLVDHLVSIDVLERHEVAGIPLLRFPLVSVAEYLAAIDRIVRGSHEALAAFLAHLPSAPGYPQDCDGFLVALSTCYRAYRVQLRLPPLNLPWERDRPPGHVSP